VPVHDLFPSVRDPGWVAAIVRNHQQLSEYAVLGVSRAPRDASGETPVQQHHR
jgi:hypothetical protein